MGLNEYINKVARKPKCSLCSAEMAALTLPNPENQDGERVTVGWFCDTCDRG